MDSKDFKQLILDRMSKGETMEDILASITATANEIEAEAKKNKSNEEIYEVITNGTTQLIADLAFEAQPLDEKALMLIILTWLCENTDATKLLDSEDLADVVDKGTIELKNIITMTNAVVGLMQNVDEGVEKAKVANPKNCDPVITFLKEFGLM